MFFLMLLLIAAAAAILWLAHDRAMTLVHPRRSQPDKTPADYNIARWEDVTFESADGVRLAGWFIPPSPDSDGATLIYVHGLGGNRAQLLGQAAFLHRLGYGALLIDLRNHGDSEGSVTTLGYDEPKDLVGAFNYLLTRAEVDGEKIGLVGESLGAATVLRAMTLIPQARVVIAESAYSSLEDNIAEGVERITGLPPFPFAPLMIWFGERETGASIREVRPIDDIRQLAPRAALLMHGRLDDLLDVSNTERLYAAASEPKALYILENAKHGGLFETDPLGYRRHVAPFLEHYLRGNS